MSERNLETYTCMEEWLEDLGSPEIRSPLDPLWHERDALRRSLWQRHFEGLGEEDQMLLQTGSHASLSSDRVDEAASYASELQALLEGVPFVCSVSVSPYHGDVLVLTVLIDEELPWRQIRAHVPELFRGFEVKVVVAP